MERKLKVFCVLLALILGVATIFGCGSKSEESDSSSESTELLTTENEPGTHTVTDHAGNQVEVPNTVNTVAICDIYPLPSIISVFFDSAEKIVGMAPQSMAAAKTSILSELYPEILNADTGFTDGTNVNMEELIALNPDVVFYNAGNKALGEEIGKAGLCGIAFSAGKWKYDALETLNQWILTLSDVFQTESTRYEAVKEYGQKMKDFVDERLKTVAEKKKVFFLFQYTAENLLSAGNPSFGSYWAEAIGADFVVTETTEKNSLPTTMEQIYTWDPDVVFITNFTTAKAGDLANNTIGSYDWSGVRAVKEGNVYKMPLGMYRTYTSGADSPMALLWLAKACYPEIFDDLEMVTEVQSYYRDVFGIELTDEQTASIFNPPAEAGIMK